MKFFETYVGEILVYGNIGDGMYSVCMNDYRADDFSSENGKEKNTRAAWKKIFSRARKTNNENQ